MKAIKVTKKMLKMHPADLMVSLGAIDEAKKILYPQHVYFSKEDIKELRKNLKELARKSIPGSSSRMLSYSVGMDWLNYSPNESLADAMRTGYGLIDYKAIETDQKAEKAFDELLPKQSAKKNK